MAREIVADLIDQSLIGSHPEARGVVPPSRHLGPPLALAALAVVSAACAPTQAASPELQVTAQPVVRGLSATATLENQSQGEIITTGRVGIATALNTQTESQEVAESTSVTKSAAANKFKVKAISDQTTFFSTSDGGFATTVVMNPDSGTASGYQIAVWKDNGTQYSATLLQTKQERKDVEVVRKVNGKDEIVKAKLNAVSAYELIGKNQRFFTLFFRDGVSIDAFKKEGDAFFAKNPSADEQRVFLNKYLYAVDALAPKTNKITRMVFDNLPQQERDNMFIQAGNFFFGLSAEKVSAEVVQNNTPEPSATRVLLEPVPTSTAQVLTPPPQSTRRPSPEVTAKPTEAPILVPTKAPTEAPKATVAPTAAPTEAPTAVPKITIEGVGEVTKQEQIAIETAVTVFKKVFNIPEAQKVNLSVGTIIKVDGSTGSVILTKDGLPLAIKNVSGEWKSNVLTQEFISSGLGFGMIHDSSNNPFATEIKLSPRNSAIIAENATMVTSTEGFYWNKIFWDRTSGTDSKKQDWAWADEYINFLKSHNIQDASPRIIDPLDNYYNSWLLDLANSSPKNEATVKMFTNILQTNIKQIVRHSKATIHSWTVNEILNDTGGMRDNVWMRTIGADYVKLAIQAIRQEDPNAQIVLNDYYLEKNPDKNKKMVDFTQQLLNEGVLKEGDIVGFEGHRSVLEGGITSEQIKNAARPFIDMGLRVRITELDAFDVFSNDVKSQSIKADLYMKYIQAAIELNKEYRARGKKNDVVDAVVLLATTHSESWQHWNDKGRTIFPALFSDDGYPEQAYYFLAQKALALLQ